MYQWVGITLLFSLFRLAIGTGDGKICIWNLSTDNYVDITTLSKKIDNKVMSVSITDFGENAFNMELCE